MSTPVQQSEAPATFERRLFSAEDIHRMLDASILKPGERVQLLRGGVVMVDDHSPRLFTVEEYRRMAEAGILAPDERVELIDGEVFVMSPIGDPHAWVVDLLARLLIDLVGERAIVRIQNPVWLEPRMEPQPDLALLRPRGVFYKHNTPTPADVLLLIEVSDTTLPQDRAVKVPRYARSGIAEVWIVNLQQDIVEVYANLVDDAYSSIRQAQPGESLLLPGLPDLSLGVAEIFG